MLPPPAAICPDTELAAPPALLLLPFRHSGAMHRSDAPSDAAAVSLLPTTAKYGEPVSSETLNDMAADPAPSRIDA